MPTKPRNEDQKIEAGTHIIPPATLYSQPWWRGVGDSSMSSSLENANSTVKNGAIQSQNNGDAVDKEKHMSVAPQSGLSGHDGQEQQHLKPLPSSTPQSVGEHLDPNSQMELVGHSIMVTPYPYPDPHYGGMMTYGVQVHPHLLGLNQTRMPLPLEMEEEPVYVNAKQYHGILRRRQVRAKAELEKKVIKARKPYLHESRHQHAMRRERGCGGRFLKKPTNSTSENEPKSGETLSTQSANSSGSEHWPANGDGNSYQLQKGSHNFSNGSSNGHGHSHSSMYYSSRMDSEKEGNCFNQERESMLVHHSPHGAARIK